MSSSKKIPFTFLSKLSFSLLMDTSEKTAFLMKKNIYIASALLLAACGTNKDTLTYTLTNSDGAKKYAETITAKELKTNLLAYHADGMKQKKSIAFLKNNYTKQGVTAPLSNSNYLQRVSRQRKEQPQDAKNVIAYIKGSEKPNETILISTHLNHGNSKEVDADHSGTASLLEIAKAFKKAERAGIRPKRSIAFLHLTGSEKGTLGSEYYIKNPVFPLQSIVANLDIDMIGSVDAYHKNNPNYVYVTGSDRLSTELHRISEMINKKFTNIQLDYSYSHQYDTDSFYAQSHHANFVKHKIPVISYFNGTEETTRTPINYDLLKNRTRLIFYTAWELANKANRLIIDNAVYNQAYQENYQRDGIIDIINKARNSYVLVDPFQKNVAASVAAIKARGNEVGAYINIGAGETYRDDFNAMKPFLVKKVWSEWDGEYFVNTTTTGIVDLMKARIDKVAAWGCDWVEFDNMDWFYDDESRATYGFKVTKEEGVAYYQELCDYVHEKGMKCMAKNTVENASNFDGVLYESYKKNMNWWDEAGTQRFLDAGKVVIINHYNEKKCENAYLKYKSIYKGNISFICEDAKLEKYVHFNK
ncbi:Peptidase M28 / glycoside hydrolase, family GH114 [Tenacibaculum maritimum]|nr:Peptidase M28 / glycoside hydrolase, family GH114 [Tenacibaculum maritimum]